MGDDSEWMKLPAEEKVQHKVWKARVAGYEEATKLFNQLDSEKAPEFSRYAGLMKKFVTDNNAIAQEKAMDAVLAFVENAHVAQRVANDVVNGVITKCLSSTKQKTKEKGFEILMLYVEIEKQDVVQENLLQGLENKNPKVVVGCIIALREALRDFGTKIISVKPILKTLPKLLEDRDKNVREETKQLVIEVYRWIGAALKPQMSHFKPVQVTELEAEFEKLPSQKPQQVRFLRSQQDLKAKMEEQAAARAEGGEEEVEEEESPGEDIDPFELIEAVDILSKLPKDFYEKVEAKKWQERKEALEALQKLAESPKIEQGDHGPVVRVLLKVIGKDTNVMLVALGGKCLAGLAKGLRKKFSSHAAQCFSVILDKFKEKKPMVVTALREAIDNVFFTTTIDVIQEDSLAALENKNPSIKAETALFLSRCFSTCTTATLPKKMLKAYCAALLKTVNDTAPEVREASFQALGTAMRVVTEKHIGPFLTEVEPIKMQKIKECCEKAVLLNARGEPRAGGGAPKAGSSEPKAVARPATAKPQARPGGPPPSAGAKPGGAQRPKTAPAKPGGPPRKAAAKGKGGKKAGSPGDEITENALSDEAVDEKAEALLPGPIRTQLDSANWKERLSGIEEFTKIIKGMSREEIPCQVCIRVLNKKPGLKDNNFQVLKLKVELVSHLAQNSQFTKRSAEFCLADLVDKAGDAKNGAAVQEAFSCISEACGFEYTSTQVVKMAFDQKNPKNQSEALVWLSKAIKEFGFKINIKAMIEYLKKAFAATNPAVRNAALSVTGVAYMYMGQKLRMFFEDEKPALLQQIDAEFEKVKGEKPPAPTRGLKLSVGDEEEEEEEAGEGGEEEQDVADLVPRNNVGDRFTPELVTEMSDKNWKVRGEALQKVIAILNEAKFITGNLGPLPEAIKARLGDSNKNLATTAIGICVTLATNMGPHCKHHVKVIGPGLFGCLADSKPQLRAAAIGALNAWVDQTTLTPLVEAEALSDALRVENPFMRQELLGWLSERLPNHKQLPQELKMCIPHILLCLEDRNPDVRKKAQDALVPFMIHTGYDSFARATSKLKPASKDQIAAILEKARANVPAKPAKVKKAASASAAAAPADTYSEPEAPPTKPQNKASGGGDSKPAVKGTAKSKKAAPAAPSSKKKKEEDTGPSISLVVSKEQRFKDERNMKVLKWNFTEPRLEYVEQLTTQMEKNFSKSMMEQLFHKDFKFHIKAIETLLKCMPDLQDETIGNLDLILKWFTLRFFDTNPSMLNKALEYLQRLFEMLIDVDYHLADPESNSFIPYLVIKVGENKDNVRRDVRTIFKLIYRVFPASRMFSFISDGLKSKNSKQRTECLEELGNLIENYGITICQPSPAQALKTIASQISDRDNGVRNAALNSTVTAFMILGEGIYKFITLNDKDQSLLDERIKRSMKNKQAKPAEERPRTAPAPAQRSASQATISRPSTSIPKSASSNSMRKEFQLDVEIDFKRDNLAMPQLIQYDLDELFAPVEKPKIKARPPSPSAKFFSSSDTSTTVSFVISQITSRDINVCVSALVQVDEVLKDEEKIEVMVPHIEQLLLSISMQFKMVYSTHMVDENTSSDGVIKLYRCLLGTLLTLFQNAPLARRASKDILKDLINNLITILLDQRLNNLEEGPQVVRSINVMVVKIVEKADHTNILSALIRLLQDCVGSETCSSKFQELIMKCLWRMVRMLPEIVNNLNLDRILYDTHLFMKEFPPSSWKDRSSDLPLRTIKTLLHSLWKLKGAKILTHLGQIDPGEVSDVKVFLQKVLNKGGTMHTEDMNGTEEPKPKSATKSRRLSKTSHDMLTEIFKKIGSKENTREGLNDLYDFTRKYPEADLEPFLKKCSTFFQNYIERGLKNIELERDGKKGQTSAVIPTEPVVAPQPASVTAPDANADYYMERLRVLRARCGLDNAEQEPANESAPIKTEQQQSENIPNVLEVNIRSEEKDENGPAPESSSAPSRDVSELKMRLERIKKLAKS